MLPIMPPISRRLVRHASAMALVCTVLPDAASATGTVSAASPEARLHAAATAGDITAIRQALASGVAINARNPAGATPLLLATEANQVEAARVLIEAGADVNAQNAIRNSPYLYAGARGLNEILQLTLAHGADLKSTNRYGGTALIPAAERGYVDTVRILIAAGVDVDHVNNLHWTALLEAILLGNGGTNHTEVVRLLIKAGANVNLADGDGVTPLQHARRRGFQEIEQMLVRAGAK